MVGGDNRVSRSLVTSQGFVAPHVEWQSREETEIVLHSCQDPKSESANWTPGQMEHRPGQNHFRSQIEVVRVETIGKGGFGTGRNCREWPGMHNSPTSEVARVNYCVSKGVNIEAGRPQRVQRPAQ